MYTQREGLSRLVVRPSDRERPTWRKDCGARAAISRGLKEYLEQLSIDAPVGGRALSFVQVEASYGDLWTPAKCPAANVVGGVGDAEYDSARTSGNPIECENDTGRELVNDRDALGQALPPNRKQAWFTPSSFEVTLTVECWAQDKGQRDLLELMLEEDFNPTPDWLGGGFRLELPHYCGARADYHIARGSIGYEGREAAQNRYVLRYTVEAKLDLRVRKSRPRLIPTVVLDVNGTADKVPG